MDRKAAVLERLNIPAVIDDLCPQQTRAGVDQILTLCPLHDDNHGSFSVNKATGKGHCFTGCKTSVSNIFDLYMLFRGVDFPTALHDLEARAGIAPPLSAGPAKRRAVPPATVKPSSAKADKPKPKPAPAAKITKTIVYRYRDADGVVRYLKKRFEKNDGSKTFSFRHFLPDGSEVPGRGNNPPLLYGLHRLATAPPGVMVFVVEGEKCAEALTAWELIAVCTDSGADGSWPSSFNEFFRGRTVVILPDNDPAGDRYAATVAAALLPVATCVQILRLPGLPPKGDIVDFITLQRQKGGAHD